MKIGCVKELKKYEFRVGLTPENVSEYVKNGHEVLIEAGAGEGSTFDDASYEKHGARIVASAAEVWQACDMMIKVKEPLQEEYQFLREGLIIYTYLHLAAEKQLVDALLESKTTGLAYETISDGRGGLPLLRPMSEVAGRLSVHEGAKCLEKPMGGMGKLLGGVPGVERGKVVILGGGVVGINAAKTAIGLGADVSILDNNLDRLVYLDDIFGNSVQTLYSTDTAIERAISNADLVIGAVLIPGGAAPKLIKRSHLAMMKQGSVIVDVAVDQGGCCETTKVTYHDDPTYVVDGVVHYGVGNMPGAVSQTSTVALTNATLAYGVKVANMGLEKAARNDAHIRDGVNTYMGKLTHENVAASFGMEYTDLLGMI